ncbi:MAG: MBL fold metallo-hydrolase [Candidatus Thermoplasmatota archaeon]|jgi:metallo-beta-lactamase family protein
MGGAGCVTGSRTLVEGNGSTALVDCGLFQGYKALRLLNWQKFPAKPAKLEAVVLTHAHLDHCGWLPRLMREGFDGPVYCTAATRDLARILLEDAAHIQESDARQANSGGYSKHHPAQPLYTVAEAKGILRKFKAVQPGRWQSLGDLQARFTPNGHILGSAMVEVAGDETVLWSGDLGRASDPVMPPPQDPPACDQLVLESTYGDRLHRTEDPIAALRRLLDAVARRRGVLLIPSFAVGRSQGILLLLHAAMRAGGARMPIYLDSPMSAAAMAVMSKHIALTHVDEGHWKSVVKGVQVIEDADESFRLPERPRPFVLVSSSGMATGGRILNHLKALAGSPKNTILLAGYQAGGTRGAALLAGARDIKVHGRLVPVKATVRRLENVSAHADQRELVEWVSRLPSPPKAVHLVHGEPASSNALRDVLRQRFGWDVCVPLMGDSTEDRARVRR